MNVTILGTGYVGLVSGTCFSEFGFEVCCVDKDIDKISNLNLGIMPIYEPGLKSIVNKNRDAGRLKFSNDINDYIKNADIIFIAVGTPARRGDGHADLKYIYEAAEQIAKNIINYTVIVTKSTVPIGTGDEVKKLIKKINPSADFDMVSNPEFLREGNAIDDFMRPDRVVVGVESERAKEVMSTIYKPLFLIETPIVYTDLKTAELIKYSANAFLAVKISFINQIADLCEKVGADVHDISRGMGLDKRIGSKFLHPGPGYGGSCFPKDTLALVQTAKTHNIDLSIVKTTIGYNEKRKSKMADKIIENLGNNLSNQKVAILGLAFKPGTDDMRDSPALEIIPRLLKEGITISAFDPEAMNEAKLLLSDIQFSDTIEDCLQGADALVILTEWNEFRGLTVSKLKGLLKGKILIDLRNALNPENFEESDFTLVQIGRLLKNKS